MTFLLDYSSEATLIALLLIMNPLAQEKQVFSETQSEEATRKCEEGAVLYLGLMFY